MGLTKDNGMLIDIQYVNNKGDDDYIYTIWKDLDTGEKNLSIEKNPTRLIYFEKPDCRNHRHNKTYEKIENLIPVEVKEKEKIFRIANEIGDQGKSFVRQCFTNRDYKRLNEIQLYPYVFGSDIDIRAYKRLQWKNNYDNNRPKHLSLGFLDIEVDIMEGGPDPLYNPIDLVTLIDVDAKRSYTFALTGVDYKAPKKPLTDEYAIEEDKKKRDMYAHRMKEQEYWSNNVDELKKKIHEKFGESYPDFDFNIYFYQNELMMLVHLWQLINKLKLDMIGIWNMDFDIPFIYNRIKILGGNPEDIMCHPDFPSKECWYKKDMIHFAIKEKSSWFNLSSYTIFVDQMVIYAALRKGQSELRSNKLTVIAEKELGDSKLDYSEVGTIKTLSYVNYLLYILYNIKDVLLQVGIEGRTSDMDTYYLTSYVNTTPYSEVFKLSLKLRYVQYASYLSQGLVTGNNMNSFDNSYGDSNVDEDDSSFEGALVGNPLLIEKFGMKLFGKPTNFLFQYSIDFDMGKFYPSCIIGMNIDPSTLIFKMILDSSQFDSRGGELKYRGITDVHIVKGNSDTFSGDISKEVMDNYQTGNILTFANKWLNLPSVESMNKKIRKELG